MNGLIRRIDYKAADNFLCCRLALLGFSTNLIMAKCNLSKGQVSYRLRRTGIQRRSFRDGTSELAEIVIQRTEQATRRDLEARLQPLLKKHENNV